MRAFWYLSSFVQYHGREIGSCCASLVETGILSGGGLGFKT